ncbi:uncharacterized [Tachysurus ichikawai]
MDPSAPLNPIFFFTVLLCDETVLMVGMSAPYPCPLSVQRLCLRWGIRGRFSAAGFTSVFILFGLLVESIKKKRNQKNLHPPTHRDLMVYQCTEGVFKSML